VPSVYAQSSVKNWPALSLIAVARGRGEAMIEQPSKERERPCALGHDFRYHDGICATCRRCGRAEVDGEFYGYESNKTVQAGAEDSRVNSPVDWRARYEYTRDYLSWRWVEHNKPTPEQFDEAVDAGIEAQLRIWNPLKDAK